MNQTQLQIDEHIFTIDGRQLVCESVPGGDECLRITFDHAEFDTLRNLNIASIALSPSGSEILVLLEIPLSGYKTVGNLLCVDMAGEIVWWVELTDTGRDAYVDVTVDSDTITVHSWEGYACKINPVTGRILSRSFTK